MIEDQLQRWQKRGFEVMLNTTIDGRWYCAVASPDWIMRDPRPNDAGTGMVLRFLTAPCPSPQAAVEAALQVIQP